MTARIGDIYIIRYEGMPENDHLAILTTNRVDKESYGDDIVHRALSYKPEMSDFVHPEMPFSIQDDDFVVNIEDLRVMIRDTM